jgi:GNAT superfamily N-acetyltransferase
VSESPVSDGVIIRRGDRLDVPFMRSLLAFAYNWHVNAFDTAVSISHYVDGWGRTGDTALIAMEGGHSVGAAWFRLFPGANPGYAFLDEATPELTVVVVPSRQGQGIGTKLLAALIERGKAAGYPALAVSVRRDDADGPLFLEQGFEQVREEGETLTLRLRL